MPRFGFAVQERREVVGYRTQQELARALKALADEGELPEGLKTFTQQWLSKVEKDRTGEYMPGANPIQMRTLAYMLQWSSKEFEMHTGVPIGTVPGHDTPVPVLPSAMWKVPPQPKPVPAELLQAVEEYGSKPEFKELSERRWIRFLTSLHHRQTPDSAAAWLAVFLDLRSKFDPPEQEDGPAH